jgi:hypothetical protein
VLSGGGAGMVMTSWRSFHPSALTGRPSWETRRQAEVAIFEYINDGVDAPPGGIAMCQNDGSLNCHTKEEHPWRMLA